MVKQFKSKYLRVECTWFVVYMLRHSNRGQTTMFLQSIYSRFLFLFPLQPNHARTLGVSDTDSALLIGYLSIASTVSRLLFGLFLNHPKINRFYVLQVHIYTARMFCFPTFVPRISRYDALTTQLFFVQRNKWHQILLRNTKLLVMLKVLDSKLER